MNRSIALFIALAVLVAHAFALHSGGVGDLAPPYDMAYAAFRVARNLAHEGALIWQEGVPGIDSYPSLLWVLVGALGERLTLSMSLYAQGFGVVLAATALVFASGFHRDRIASLIAPLLLSVSGAMAAAAVSGTETALLTLLVLTSFFSYERRWGFPLALSLLLCGLTGVEGWFMTLALFMIQLIEVAHRARRPRALRPPLRSFKPYILPALGFAAICLYRWVKTNNVYSPAMHSILHGDAGRFEQGVLAMRDFVKITASPALVVYSFWYLLRGRFTPTGIRALFLFLLLLGLEAARGGVAGPFASSFVPALPLGLIAAQEGMICALNSYRRWIRSLAWLSFLAAITLSALSSKRPRDMRELDLGSWQENWMTTEAIPRFGYETKLARRSLAQEISNTQILRGLGLYLRDHVEPTASVLTPWPGSIGYLSGRRIFDAQGRTNPLSPGADSACWTTRQRVALLEVLSARTDYILPLIDWSPHTISYELIAREWMEGLDVHSDKPGRFERVHAAMIDYELILIPIRTRHAQTVRFAHPILRRKSLGMTPRIELLREGEDLVVRLEHDGPQQLVDLDVRLLDGEGQAYHLTPTGTLSERGETLTRLNILLFPTGERSIELLRCELPAGIEARRAEARLRNPKVRKAADCSTVSEVVELEL